MTNLDPALVRLWHDAERRRMQADDNARKLRQARRYSLAHHEAGRAAGYEGMRLAIQRELDATPAMIRAEYHLQQSS